MISFDANNIGHMINQMIFADGAAALILTTDRLDVLEVDLEGLSMNAWFVDRDLSAYVGGSDFPQARLPIKPSPAHRP